MAPGGHKWVPLGTDANPALGFAGPVVDASAQSASK